MDSDKASLTLTSQRELPFDNLLEFFRVLHVGVISNLFGQGGWLEGFAAGSCLPNRQGSYNTQV